MGFLEAVKYKIEPVTGQFPVAGFFIAILSSSEWGYRAVKVVFFTFLRILSLFSETDWVQISHGRVGIVCLE